MKVVGDICDKFWQQVMGSREFQSMKYANGTYIKLTSFEGGILKGKGLWGSGAVDFEIDFGITSGSFSLNCGCEGMRTCIAEKDTAPCSHLLRAIVQIEAKLRNKPFDAVYKDRISSIIPF